MYRLDGDQVLRVPALEAFSWLEHGFGTKLSEDWPAEDARATLKQIHSTVVEKAKQSKLRHPTAGGLPALGWRANVPFGWRSGLARSSPGGIFLAGAWFWH